jgi:hypothetical protein
MNFQLLWPTAMLERLEQQYLRSRSLARGTDFSLALGRIEQHLANDPIACGESRDGTIRLVIDAPVTVWFEVDVVAKTVLIHDVRFFSP